MRYQRFGQTNMNFSKLCIGTWAIGGQGWGDVEENTSIEAIRSMVYNGVNCIDTALVYNNGNSERIVGKAIKDIREEVYVITKTGIFQHRNHFVKDGDPETVLQQCDEALERIGVDYLDMFIVHWPDHNSPLASTIGAMARLKEQGKIRHIGVSNFNMDQLKESMNYAQIDCVQVPYSMVNRQYEQYLKWARDHHIGTMTYGSLGAGILTGSFRSLPEFESGDMRNVFYQHFKEPLFSKIMKVLSVMDEIAEKRKVPLSQIAINWSTQKDYVSTAIVGVRSCEEAVENCAGLDWELTTEETTTIDAAIEEHLGRDFN